MYSFYPKHSFVLNVLPVLILGTMKKENTFMLTANQLQKIGFEDKLLGPKAPAAFVTRNQMSQFASEVFSSMNVFEEYEVPEYKFNTAFVDVIMCELLVHICS